MKIFLSWSGDISHKVACAFRDWLPSVIQSITPYVSSEDIDKGARWSSDIAKELNESSYGIIVVTEENIVAPWVHFEAGALSKSIDKSFVTPFLFNIKRSDVPNGPLLQFQSTVFDKEDIFKLLQSINRRLEEKDMLNEQRLEKAFEVWWPQLKIQLDKLIANIPSNPKFKKDVEKNDILEELLELVRNQQRILYNPEALLPPEYLMSIFESSQALRGRVSRTDYEILHKLINKLESVTQENLADCEDKIIIISLVKEIHDNIHRLRRNYYPIYSRDRHIKSYIKKDSIMEDIL